MAEYHAYRTKNGKMQGPAQVIICDSDVEAVEQAKQYVDGHDVELWEAERLVTILKAID